MSWSDAEKQRAKHTPQSLARDILLRNGYAVADARGEPGTAASTAADPVVAGVGRGRQGNESVEREQRELPTHSAPHQRSRVSVSPESLTADQLQLVERRRREALERRRRKDALAACTSASSGQQEVCFALGVSSCSSAPERVLTLLRLVCSFVRLFQRNRCRRTLHWQRGVSQRMDRLVAPFRVEMRQMKLSEASRLVLRLERGSQ